MKIPQIWWIFLKSPHICGGKRISGLLNYIYRRMEATGNRLWVKRKGEIKKKDCLVKKLIVKNFENGSKKELLVSVKKNGWIGS